MRNDKEWDSGIIYEDRIYLKDLGQGLLKDDS